MQTRVRSRSSLGPGISLRAPRVLAWALAALFVVLPVRALAAWSVPGTGAGRARADVMPAGGAPTVSVTGRNVTVSWTPARFADGDAVAGYRVTRYDGSGSAAAPGTGCSGVVSALTCTENAVPPGRWTYAVTPVQARWNGVQSRPSAPVSVAAPALSLAPTVVAPPATLSGTISGFVSGQSVTFRMDDPTAGPLLGGTVTPAPVGDDGGASVTVTIPTGTSTGIHTVYAVDGAGDVAAQQVTVDATAPTISGAVVAKASGGTPGYVHQGGTYYVFANVVDGGSASTGVATVSANVASLTGGASSIPLTSGSYSVGGVTYGYRSAALTADMMLTQGSKSFSITAVDGVGNTATQSFTVTVDNTAPSASDVQTINVSGGTAGKAERGDRLILTYSENVEPGSILSAWAGSSTAVTVRLTHVNAFSDQVTVYDGSNVNQLPLGTVSLGRGDYVAGTVTFTASTMSLSGRTVTITLGTPSGPTKTALGAGTMSWTPAATVTDYAGNQCLSAAAVESGSLDKDF